MPITDLTGTKWLLKSSFSAISSPTYYINKYNTYYSEGYSTPFYKINFTCNNTNYYGLGTNIYEGAGTSFPKASLLHNQLEFITSSTSSAFFSLANKSQYQSYSSQASFNGWPATTPSSSVISSNPIIITGGEDVTNANLILWLDNNATQVVEPSGSMSLGTNNISKMSLGNTEVSKVFLGNVKVYEKQTSVNYQVTVSYSGPYSATFYDGEDWNGTELVQIFGGDNAQTVTCTTGKIYANVVGGIQSITGSNGATSTNPSTITANNASIVIVGGNES